MTTMLSNNLDMFAKRSFPVLAGIFFVLISTVPYYIPGFGPVAPNVVLIAVFFWVIHHAEFVPTATVFFIGLFCFSFYVPDNLSRLQLISQYFAECFLYCMRSPNLISPGTQLLNCTGQKRTLMRWADLS